MNKIKKIYCRIFQLCFRAALPVLPYREPKILTDMEELGRVLKEKGKHRVLIVTDKGISSLGLLRGLEDGLKKAGVSYVIYDDTVQNPTIDNVEQARQVYLSNDCNAVIAFGAAPPLIAPRRQPPESQSQNNRSQK